MPSRHITCREGELIRFVLTGRVEKIRSDGAIEVAATGAHSSVAIYPNEMEDNLTRLEPADGKPQPGEIWTDDGGTVYAAVAGHGIPPKLIEVTSGKYWSVFELLQSGLQLRRRTAVPVLSDQEGPSK